MPPQPIIRDWARRLIAGEVDADPLSAQTQAATLSVYEKLRRQLCAPVGVDGFQALASRAVSLAKSQSPGLSPVQVMANGALSGFSGIEFQRGTDENDEVGIILIAQLLGLVFTLLGEAATVSLIADVPFRVEKEAQLDPAGVSAASSTNYLGPFEGISLEADRLRNVSERLETLADRHVGIEEVMSVAGSIRNIAAVLDVFTLIRSKTDIPQEDTFGPPQNGYVN